MSLLSHWFYLMRSSYPGALPCARPLKSVQSVPWEEQQQALQAWLQGKEGVSQGPAEFVRTV